MQKATALPTCPTHLPAFIKEPSSDNLLIGGCFGKALADLNRDLVKLGNAVPSTTYV